MKNRWISGEFRGRFIITLLLIFILVSTKAASFDFQFKDSGWHSTKEEALNYLNSIKQLGPSSYWPNVDGEVFLANLKTFVISPLQFTEGRSTFFCAYSALTYIPFYYNPLVFCRFMISLYKNGRAKMGKAFLQ